ncbi:spore cortex biosynthesis protein YabQ [Clostridium botulinum]|uniref:Spore cortex biosynthesis protein YabQ n=1 Tax=Clostridium botulinum C/D str. DC5 TaxID=1443128 RepID=A0A0A0I6W9_CLOBO|nr:spore cortex biosynthesis protein YabQ [Clostridium botulinum]KEI00734.1 spore cortex biosynthesis protein YabQ [Clostridium botulinum C/D str. BKT75002]KEI08480.1 spore cortex biosynthesis protein YabQ [Clostridium botulinum C/D str. BKT2873]KGM96056.1 spore cortex biosynthesis protein YabQ [Clostridium botulinum C/D str. DC5]KGM96739.1 spore cortex biosynthesis protein YabQ [Clostridium botulinum D str. CCUG 7971]KOC51255.1 spore cortex biosynthesis protein YabQ [Clostridium botulinum]
MLIPIHSQFNLIFYSVLAGVLTGVLFDIYRILRGFENPNKILTFIEDILFWIFTGILVFIFLLYTGHVYVGIYLYLYIALGIYIYMRFISVHFLKIQYKLIRGIFKFLRILKNLFVYFLELMFCKVTRKNK